jgi:hypothetical protein
VLAELSPLLVIALLVSDMTNLLRYNYDIIIISKAIFVNRMWRAYCRSTFATARSASSLHHAAGVGQTFAGGRPASDKPGPSGRADVHKEISMRKLLFASLASASVLALAACGSSDDASADAEADTVEMPADEAMTEVEDPVLDEAATEDAEEATAASADEAATAAEAASEAAADAAAAAAEAAESAAE